MKVVIVERNGRGTDSVTEASTEVDPLSRHKRSCQQSGPRQRHQKNPQSQRRQQTNQLVTTALSLEVQTIQYPVRRSISLGIVEGIGMIW